MADVDLDRVEARVAQHHAPSAYCSVMVAMSAAVTACVRRIPSGLNTRNGATLGDLVPSGFATGPAWPIWAEMAAPSSCTASVSARSPSPHVGAVEHDLMAVGGAGAGHGAVRDSRHPHPARREAPVEFDELRRNDPLRSATLEGRGLDDAIAQGNRPERGGRERIGGGHGATVARSGADRLVP